MARSDPELELPATGPPDDEAIVTTTDLTRPSPALRRDTLSSKAGSEGTLDRGDTCRICRSEGTPDEPLFYPCKCSGSIKFVHQECLMEWLSHSHKKYCELCKTPFRFTKLYDANMPQQLPWRVFLQRACWHAIQLFARVARGTLVAFVWLGVIPWVIRWVWRWVFWVADAAWAREAFIDMMQADAAEKETKQMTAVEWMASALQRLIRPNSLYEEFEGPLAYTITNAIATNLGLGTENATSSSAFAWPQADPSILSSWTYVASLTTNPRVNRVILDVFEGQIITCVVITGFILVFLIREWVVQQQPLVNLQENIQGQLREVGERVQMEEQRLREQHEILERARQMLVQLQNDTGVFISDDGNVDEHVTFVGWQAVEAMMDEGTENLRKLDEEERSHFKLCAERVRKQVVAARRTGLQRHEVEERLQSKLTTYTNDERTKWQDVLALGVLPGPNAGNVASNLDQTSQHEPETGLLPNGHNGGFSRRPPMPARGFSSQATNIQRLLVEADAVFNQSTANQNDRAPSPNEDANDSRSSASRDSCSKAAVDMRDEQVRLGSESMPITNAGPDAKINIKRSGKQHGQPVPEPRADAMILTDDQRKKQMQEQLMKRLEEEMRKSSSYTTRAAVQREQPSQTGHEENPFHPDGPEPERRNSESFSNRVASAFREEFGLDESAELEQMREADPGVIRAANEAEAAGSEHQLLPIAEAQPGVARQITNWFWGDIRPVASQEPLPPPDEEEPQEDVDNEAPFVPILDRRPARNNAAVPDLVPQAAPQHDPEVLAAAQQAGLDPEALEDAEDLEGIFELIGFQGPLIGLFQTSAFASLLVICTILLAVILPYIGGKMVLNIVGSPFNLLVKVPLQVASFVADFIIDVALMLGGWTVMLFALAADFLVSALEAWVPKLSSISLAEKIMDLAKDTASNAGTRLCEFFVPIKEVDASNTEAFTFSWGLLASSVHAHASLRTLQDEVNAIMRCMGTAVTFGVEAISTGSVATLLKNGILAVAKWSNVRNVSARCARYVWNNLQPLLESARGLRSGAVTVTRPKFVLDPSLVYWNSADRALAILSGYTALAFLATLYVAFDRPISKSESGRRTEKVIRDTLRQAGGVLKVILIISIEMLVFPLYCGLLLDIAFLPLFQDATMASRWAFAGRSPYTFCFVHWFIGTCYMFHFALFVGMCRKILRKGVLWFIRDPDDPTFHPVRDVLERSVATQLRKIAFSALVYGALVILCLGGVIWTIGQLCEGIFPIYWVSTEPILEFPVDLLLYNFITPLIVRLFKPSDTLNAMYAWWLRRCARMLRLSHFLFDDRRRDEEGHFVYKSWTSFLLRQRPDVAEVSAETHDDQQEAYFERDGKYVLTPCNDQYRPPKPDEIFLHDDGEDVYMIDKEGKRNELWAKMYVPPLFRMRITLFMVCLWMFSAVTGLCVTLVPLVFGRAVLAFFIPSGRRVNDIYAYSLGAYALSALCYVSLKGQHGALHLQDRATKGEFQAWIQPAKRFTTRLLKCIYVYGFIGIVLPCLFALLLQFYFILPLHTAFTSVNEPATMEHKVVNATMPSLLNDTTTSKGPSTNPATLAQHTIHLLQDYALGLLYVRIASRVVIGAPASRAAEAFRRITADGYLNPNVKLATRFLVLPATLIAAFALVMPPLAAGVVVEALQRFAPLSWGIDHQATTKLYRYSFPIASTCLVVMLTFAELGKATSRWRARIRDEVYLVGERLHNFGEKKPPPGSRSVVRREKP